VSREAAVAAAERGWHVFPCLPGDKRPSVDHWEDRACADPRRVWRYWPSERHNVGIACGPSRLVVVDLDVHGTLPLGWQGEPGIVDGRDVLAALAERAGQSWPSTHMVATPSGGWHLYYEMPAGIEIRNSASKAGPMGVVRGHGGYVGAAGSSTEAGTYETLSGPEEPVEPLPAWLLRLVFPPAGPSPLVREKPVRPVGNVRLRGVVDHVLDGRPGDRNGRVYWGAQRAREMVAEGQMDQEEAEQVLVDAAVQAGLRGGEKEARATIASAFRGQP
jgi:hypothetical protein